MAQHVEGTVKTDEGLQISLERLERNYVQMGGTRAQLETQLRRQVVFERNSIKLSKTAIWRDMIEQERRVAAVVSETHYSFTALFCVVLLFVALLLFPVLDAPEQNGCFALLLLCGSLWAFEVCFI